MSAYLKCHHVVLHTVVMLEFTGIKYILLCGRIEYNPKFIVVAPKRQQRRPKETGTILLLHGNRVGADARSVSS